MHAPKIVIRNGVERSWYQHKKQVWLFSGKGVDGIPHTEKCVQKPWGLYKACRKAQWAARLRLMASGAAKREQVSDPLWWWEICKWLQLSEYRGSSVSHQAKHSYGTAAVGDSDNPEALLRWRHFIFSASGPNPSLYYQCSMCLPWGLYTCFVLFLSRLKYHSPPCSMPLSLMWMEDVHQLPGSQLPVGRRCMRGKGGWAFLPLFLTVGRRNGAWRTQRLQVALSDLPKQSQDSREHHSVSLNSTFLLMNLLVDR